MAGRVKAKKEGRHRFYDLELLVSIIFLCVFGLVMIYSASSYKAQLDYGKSSYFVEKQAVFELVSFVAMLIISKLDYHRFAKYAVPAYLVSYVLLGLTAFTPMGVASHGKKRWLRLGPVQFQPTEFIKIALILLIAVIISKLGVKINELRRVRTIILLCIPLAMGVTLNNLSSGIIICGIVYVMLFVAVKKKWPFFVLLGFLVGVLILAPYIGDLLVKMKILQDYQLARINVWRNPVKYSRSGGYQVLQGLYAIGSGGFFGKGLGQSLQKLGFVPEAQNDMIFSIICEELGLFGAVCLILMFMFMIYRFVVIAENAPDLFGSMLVVGIMAHIAIQVILNIAVVTNVIPNTGVTLPFISYGGTSVMLLMAEMGIALSVSNQIKQEEKNV
ncbi:MAG: putative lipid II flippase FtsW [Clostridium sp.]|nr:putative lipid II flippase FtsW [Clostridium sp.]